MAGKLTDSLPFAHPKRAQLKEQFSPKATHGGRPSLKKRKVKRPYFAGTPLQLCLTSSRAKGPWALKHRKNRSKISSMVYGYAARNNIKVYRARIEGQEIHLLVKTPHRKALADFLRVLAGRVAVVVTQAKKGQKRIGKFWSCLTWSRLVSWGADFFHTSTWIQFGKLELKSASVAPLTQSEEAALKPIQFEWLKEIQTLFKT